MNPRLGKTLCSKCLGRESLSAMKRFFESQKSFYRALSEAPFMYEPLQFYDPRSHPDHIFFSFLMYYPRFPFKCCIFQILNCSVFASSFIDVTISICCNKNRLPTIQWCHFNRRQKLLRAFFHPLLSSRSRGQNSFDPIVSISNYIFF